MKSCSRFLAMTMIFSAPTLAGAQQSAAPVEAAPKPNVTIRVSPPFVANPVTATIKSQLPRYTKIMVAAAQSMPAEKFSFKPTPEMNTFGHLVMHIVESNDFLCSKIAGTSTPDVKLAETDGKEKLVSALQASFEFCATALANVDDSKLGEPMILFGNRPGSRAAALIFLSGGWSDHYGAEAIYLRLNGILPPTAQTQRPEEKKKE